MSRFAKILLAVCLLTMLTANCMLFPVGKGDIEDTCRPDLINPESVRTIRPPSGLSANATHELQKRHFACHIARDEALDESESRRSDAVTVGGLGWLLLITLVGAASASR